MDLSVLIPVYGPAMKMFEVTTSDEPFEQRAYDAVYASTVSGIHLMFAVNHAAHLAAVGEGSALSLLNVKKAQRVVKYGPGAGLANGS